MAKKKQRMMKNKPRMVILSARHGWGSLTTHAADQKRHAGHQKNHGAVKKQNAGLRKCHAGVEKQHGGEKR